MAGKKWFRILAHCPMCSMRVNVDKLCSQEPVPVDELTGHSVVSTGDKGLINLMGPVSNVDLVRVVKEQLALKTVALIKMMAVEFDWLKPHIVKELELDTFGERSVELMPLERPVEPAFKREQKVGGIETWQDVRPHNQEVVPVHARDVVEMYPRTALSVQPVASRWQEMPVSIAYQQVQPPDPKALKKALALSGGKTNRATGV